MNTQDFSTSIVVDQSPQEVYNAINNVRGWWSEAIEGHTDRLNETFRYHYEDIHNCTMKLTALIPGKKVVWQVLDNYFKFTRNKKEWTGTQIIFDISQKDGRTQLHFTHHGLVQDYECFDICSKAWTQYIGQSLFGLITTGKGQPNSAGNPQTEDERKMGSSAAGQSA